VPVSNDGTAISSSTIDFSSAHSDNRNMSDVENAVAAAAGSKELEAEIRRLESLVS
jgi:hypothetical protein